MILEETGSSSPNTTLAFKSLDLTLPMKKQGEHLPSKYKALVQFSAPEKEGKETRRN